MAVSAFRIEHVKIAYIGNFEPEHSTENHVRIAWEHHGHTVIRVQEGEQDAWEKLISRIGDVELILWTRTADLAARVGHRTQWRMLAAAERAGVPTVGFHLDRWWGLSREATVWEEPFFRCQYVITADGGHQAEFESVGVNHIWMPPAVSLPETELGESKPQWRSEIAFVGSWRPGYHAEWTHRPQLVDWLRKNYGNRITFWPRANQPGIRGQDLRDLYASTDIVIGDSCLVGDVNNYWSDRIPETVGRGGFLIHPHVDGIEKHYTVGDHLWTWPVGDWDALRQEIESAIASPLAVAEVREAGREHVREHHTYERRVEQILEVVK